MMADDEPRPKKIKTEAEDDVGKSTQLLPESNERAHFITEEDVGITEYLSNAPGFSGILKQRYSDFIVNEIDSNGDVVRLTENAAPAENHIQIANIALGALSEVHQQKLRGLLDSDDKMSVITLEAAMEKDERAKIHAAIRARFPELDSNTEERNGVKVICVKRKKLGERGRGRWPRDRPDHLQFTLYKENKDTMDALDLIAKHMRAKVNVFSYAGTKDRRAKTSQQCTAYRVTADRLLTVQKSLRNISLGNFRYVKDPLRLGQLSGNRFTVVLRSVGGTADEITTSLTSLQLHGFINYFGMQRFGTTTVPTHHIGRALLRSRWEEAVDLILQPRPADQAEMVDCRRIWHETRDAQQALARVTRRASIEKALLTGLVKHGATDFLSAFNGIPRSTRLMYAHSYQSYVWNKATSHRLATLGHQPVIGDLVAASNTNADDTNEAVVVTEDNIPNYTIYDVVLPLPGHRVMYPQNLGCHWYEDILSADGIDIHNMTHTNKDYSLPGTYRHIVGRVSDMQWSILNYSDHTIPLALSDYDILQGVTLPNHESAPEGGSVAVSVSFSLPPSTYATMALREVLRADTSPSHQASLNTT